MEALIFAFSVLLAPVVLAFLEARGDAQRIEFGLPIDHASSAALRLAILVPLALWATWPPPTLVRGSGLPPLEVWLWVGDIVAASGLSLSIFWLSFDIMLNSMRGLPLTYVGKEAEADQLLGYLSPASRIWLKVGLMVMFSIILILA